MKLELSSIIQLLSLGVSATAINLPRQTTPDPGFVCDFTIRTTVVPGQPPSTSRFNNLYLNGGGYKQSHKVKLAPEGGQTWCYNGTHIGNGPVTAPPSTAYGFGLNLEYQENGEDRWSHVWSTNWMASNTPTTSLTGFWKVLPGRKIEWTNKKEDGIRFGGWLACYWTALTPQLFWYSVDLVDFKQLPQDCAVVELMPVVSNSTQVAEKPPVWKDPFSKSS